MDALPVRGLLVGFMLGVPLAAANVYAGLKLGYVDAGTMTILLVCFALFGRGPRRFTAHEANMAQVTGSSAGAMAVTAGLIGPIPALAMSDHPASPLTVIVWSVALAAFGTLAARPFRASLIEIKQLAFPGARAAGEVIRNLFAGAAQPSAQLGTLAVAALLAAAVTVLRDGLHVIPDAVLLPLAIAGVPAAQLSIGVAASPLLAGVGLLVGARTALSMLLGAAIAWLGIAPQLVHAGLATASYPAVVGWTLWPGAALMVAGSLTALVLAGGALLRALRGGNQGRPVFAALAPLLVILAWRGFGIDPLYAALGVVLAALFAVAAMHATGETDTTPSGALGGLSQILVGAIGPGGVATPLATGAMVNGAAVHASTMMNAYKTADVIGARSERPLVVAQLLGIVAGALAGVLAYWLVGQAYGLGTAAMPAPGATSWKATADAVAHGAASMPAGAPLAALIAAVVAVALTLAERKTRALPSAVALGVGFIVPASIAAALSLGALIVAILARGYPGWQARSGPPLASGLIVGEALTGVVIAAVLVSSS